MIEHNELIFSKWFPVYLCIDCHKQLSEHEMMYSSGVCPYCGNKKGTSIVECHKKSARYVFSKEKIIFGLFTVKMYLRTEIKD